LTQGFFAQILHRGGFASVTPGRTRFRSYLLGALKHFLADQRKRDQRLKRGGGQRPEPLQAPPAETRETSLAIQVADPTGWPPDSYFDREWALTVMQRALEALHREFAADGRADEFAALKPWLAGETPTLSQPEAAARLGMSEGAVKVAIHRLRKRFRELVRLELAQTVEDETEVEPELKYFVEVLAAH
jgi:RNA polymerase sigma-70 factor (ECF subfamily)